MYALIFVFLQKYSSISLYFKVQKTKKKTHKLTTHFFFTLGVNKYFNNFNVFKKTKKLNKLSNLGIKSYFYCEKNKNTNKPLKNLLMTNRSIIKIKTPSISL
jgi:hypothetical protein